MAIIKVGLKRAEKSQGQNPTGQKVYLVGSDTKISDDIDTILDASYLGGSAVPAYNDLWSIDTTINLRVDTKRASAWDEEEGTQEGYWWVVTINYAVPEINSNQNDEDPRNRDWLWSKTNEKSERVLVSSLFDTSDYVYPEAGADQMVNLSAGDAITNTAFEPPEGGVVGPVSNGVITLSKYIDSASDVGPASFALLDAFIDTLNDADFTLLGITYGKWELYMDDISYEPVNENGYDVIKIVFRIIVDTRKTHVFTFPSAGYNQIVNGKKVPAFYSGGASPNSPRLLDGTGAVIPEPVSAPFISTPYLVSAGRNPLADWSTLNLPNAIP